MERMVRVQSDFLHKVDTKLSPSGGKLLVECTLSIGFELYLRSNFFQKSDSEHDQVILASEECEHIPRAESTFTKPLNEWTRGQTKPELSNRKQGGIGESQLLPMSSATSSTNDNPIATMPLARIAR